MQLRTTAHVFALAVLIALAGCYQGTARTVSVGDLGRDSGWVLVAGLSPIRQSTDSDCGAAALATMLRHWSVASSPGEILQAVPSQSGHGITMGALRDYARHKGLAAFVIQGEMDDLFKEVGLNHPVLVGLLQRHGSKSLAHFEVVAGINQITRRVLLLDPAHGLSEDSFDGFATEWRAAGRPALVIVPS